jgi:hypothetical protein
MYVFVGLRVLVLTAPLVLVCSECVIHHCRSYFFSLQLREMDRAEWYFVASQINEFGWKASHVDRVFFCDTGGY